MELILNGCGPVHSHVIFFEGNCSYADKLIWDQTFAFAEMCFASILILTGCAWRCVQMQAVGCCIVASTNIDRGHNVHR